MKVCEWGQVFSQPGCSVSLTGSGSGELHTDSPQISTSLIFLQTEMSNLNKNNVYLMEQPLVWQFLEADPAYK